MTDRKFERRAIETHVVEMHFRHCYRGTSQAGVCLKLVLFCFIANFRPAALLGIEGAICPQLKLFAGPSQGDRAENQKLEGTAYHDGSIIDAVTKLVN